jgi:hypothetical protein
MSSAVADLPVVDAPARARQTLDQLQVIDRRACELTQTRDGFWDAVTAASEDYQWGFQDSVCIRRVMTALCLPRQITINHVMDWFWWRSELDELIDHSFDGHMAEFR